MDELNANPGEKQQEQKPLQEQPAAAASEPAPPAIVLEQPKPIEAQPPVIEIPTMAPPEQPKQAETKPGMDGRIIAISIAVAAVLLAAYFVYSNYAGAPPGTLLAMLSSRHIDAASAESIIFSKVNASQMFNVSYSGTIVINSTGSTLGGASVDIPLTISFEKYQNASRTYISARGFPLAGNFSAIIISLGNGHPTYGCYNMTTLYQSIANYTPPGSVYRCIQLSSRALAIPNPLNLSFNASSLKNITLGPESLSSFSGQLCYRISANGTMDAGGTLANRTRIRFNGCMSKAYYIPLNMTAEISGSGGIDTFASFRETSIGGNVTYAEVSALPGPVVNSSSSLISENSSIANSNVTSFPTLPQNSTLSSIFSGQRQHVGYDILAGFVQQKFNQSNTLNISYSGTQTSYTIFNGSRSKNLTTNSTIGLEKYLDNISESQTIFLAGMSSKMMYMSLNGTKGRYLCSGMGSNTAISNFTCEPMTFSSFVDPMSFLSDYRLTLYPLDEMNLTEGVQGSVLGYPCTVIDGAGFLGSSSLVSKASFTTCISNRFGVPLSLYATVQSGTLVTVVNLTARSLRNSSAAIALPGAVRQQANTIGAQNNV